MFKRILAIVLALTMPLCFTACDKKHTEKDLPQYASKQFEISGFWAPYEISEESFQQYKDVGFTTLAMINHSLGYTSEEQFYLGSDRTMTALEYCKKVGLNAILNYNDWIVPRCEEDEDFYGETPFSKHDIYGEYKYIITGIHICDEPYLKNWNNENHFETYGNKTLVEDFKKVYPNAKFIVNLIPITAVSSRGFDSYDEMMELYEKTFMEPFENPFVSVDVYPFHQNYTLDDGTLLANYEYIANSAKKYNVKPAYILQSSVGGADEGKKEFEMSLSESDLRWEIYNALAFGADTLQYYCYSVPKSFDEDGNSVYMYDNCILNRDDTPSDVYYSLQKLHKEIQSFADVILSYDWDTTIGVSGSVDQTFRVCPLEYDENLEFVTLKNTENYVSAKGTQDMIVSRFTSDEYGEAYMFLNWADREKSNTVTATFKDCTAVAIYGGEDYSGTPEIVTLDEEGKLELELAYGEGVFVTPLTK
ncbi:MAG: hypothetical protein IJN22_01245 [Clostridia bacterium]|nr:hypothetical protein [Clostridia bacterium]